MKRPLLGGVQGPAKRNFHILALSGGGFRGLFTATVLSALEARSGVPARNMFDMIAGTSIGGILALGLAAGVPAGTIRDTIIGRGPAIFDARLRLLGKRIPFTSPLRPWVRTKFKADELERTIAAILEGCCDDKLAELPCATLIVSVNHSYGRPAVFRSYAGANGSPAALTLLEAALATSAAPGFFPPRRSADGVLVDGGLIANAPELLAVTDAISAFRSAIGEIRLLSIGTAAKAETQQIFSGAPGHIGWIARRGLAQVTMAAQEHLAVEQAKILLNDRYLRIDRPPAHTDVGAIGLDRADGRAINVLLRLAGEAWSAAIQRHALEIGHFCRHRSKLGEIFGGPTLGQ